MDCKQDNDGGTSDLKTPLFDMESELLELDTNADETNSSSVDECCMDDRFHPSGSRVSEDQFPESHHDDQIFYTTLYYRTMTCVIDCKGVVKICVPVEKHIPNDEKMKLLDIDISRIEKRLRSSLWINHLGFCIESKMDVLGAIDCIVRELSELDDYWNGHYLVTKELNRQINELNYSNTGLCYLNHKVAYLYYIYTNTKQRLQKVLIIYRNDILVSFDNKHQNFFINWAAYGLNPNNYAPIGPDSESDASDSESVASDSESVASDSESVASHACSDSRSEFWIDDNESDSYESISNTDIVNVDVAVVETIAETPTLNNNARFRRIKWIAGTFYLIVMILWLGAWLGQLQCCDMQNNCEWSFEFGLRHINGPPQTRDMDILRIYPLQRSCFLYFYIFA